MEDTLEKRILKSNLSDDDKIEIIRRLKSYREYVYIPQRIDNPPLPSPLGPYYTNQPYCNYCGC